MLLISSAGDAQTMDEPVPQYPNQRFCVYKRPLPEPKEIRPDEIGNDVPKFAGKYVNGEAIGCICGLYWLKSALCQHWYSSHSIYCGGATKDRVSYYCNPRKIVNFQVHCLLIKMACERCRRQNGRDMTREVDNYRPVELFRDYGT
jgi:hypothetical protein